MKIETMRRLAELEQRLSLEFAEPVPGGSGDDKDDSKDGDDDKKGDKDVFSPIETKMIKKPDMNADAKFLSSIATNISNSCASVLDIAKKMSDLRDIALARLKKAADEHKEKMEREMVAKGE